MNVMPSHPEDNANAAAGAPLSPSIDAVLSRAAAACPAHAAVKEWASGRTLSYAQLDGAASSLARWLDAAGIGHGAAVAVHLPNTAEFLIAKFAAFRAGGVAAYVNFRLSPAEAARQIGLSGARIVVTTAEKAALLREDAALKDVRFVLSDGGRPLGESLALAVTILSARFFGPEDDSQDEQRQPDPADAAAKLRADIAHAFGSDVREAAATGNLAAAVSEASNG